MGGLGLLGCGKLGCGVVGGGGSELWLVEAKKTKYPVFLVCNTDHCKRGQLFTDSSETTMLRVTLTKCYGEYSVYHSESQQIAYQDLIEHHD